MNHNNSEISASTARKQHISQLIRITTTKLQSCFLTLWYEVAVGYNFNDTSFVVNNFKATFGNIYRSLTKHQKNAVDTSNVAKFDLLLLCKLLIKMKQASSNYFAKSNVINFIEADLLQLKLVRHSKSHSGTILSKDDYNSSKEFLIGFLLNYNLFPTEAHISAECASISKPNLLPTNNNMKATVNDDSSNNQYKQNRKQLQTLLRKATKCYEAENYKGALTYCNSAIEMLNQVNNNIKSNCPTKSCSIYYIKAQCLFQLHMKAALNNSNLHSESNSLLLEAKQIAIEATTISEAEDKVHHLLGEICYELSDFNGAILAFNSALSLNPDNTLYYAALHKCKQKIAPSAEITFLNEDNAINNEVDSEENGSSKLDVVLDAQFIEWVATTKLQRQATNIKPFPSFEMSNSSIISDIPLQVDEEEEMEITLDLDFKLCIASLSNGLSSLTKKQRKLQEVKISIVTSLELCSKALKEQDQCNIVKAFELFNNAAQYPSSVACYFLASYYNDGEGCSQSSSKALDIALRGCASEWPTLNCGLSSSDEDSLQNICNRGTGMCYYLLHTLEAQNSVAHLQQAAIQNISLAQNQLAVKLAKIKGTTAEIVELLLSAAAESGDCAYAFLNLAILHLAANANYHHQNVNNVSFYHLDKARSFYDTYIATVKPPNYSVEQLIALS